MHAESLFSQLRMAIASSTRFYGCYLVLHRIGCGGTRYRRRGETNLSSFHFLIREPLTEVPTKRILLGASCELGSAPASFSAGALGSGHTLKCSWIASRFTTCCKTQKR